MNHGVWWLWELLAVHEDCLTYKIRGKRKLGEVGGLRLKADLSFPFALLPPPLLLRRAKVVDGTIPLTIPNIRIVL